MRKILFILVTTILMISLLSCQEELTAKQTLDKLYENQKQVENYQVDFNALMNIDVQMADIPSDVKPFLDMLKNLKVEGQMAYKNTDKIGDFASDYTLHLNGMSMTMEMYFDGDQMILNYPMIPQYMVMNINDLLQQAEAQGQELPFTGQELIMKLDALISLLADDVYQAILSVITEDHLELLETYEFENGTTSKAVKVTLDRDLMVDMMKSLFTTLQNNEDLYNALKSMDTNDEIPNFEEYKKMLESAKAELDQDIQDEFSQVMGNLSYTYILGYDKAYNINNIFADMLIGISDPDTQGKIDLSMAINYIISTDSVEVTFPELDETNTINLLDMVKDQLY